jgi:hypothetical protein
MSAFLPVWFYLLFSSSFENSLQFIFTVYACFGILQAELVMFFGCLRLVREFKFSGIQLSLPASSQSSMFVELLVLPVFWLCSGPCYWFRWENNVPDAVTKTKASTGNDAFPSLYKMMIPCVNFRRNGHAFGAWRNLLWCSYYSAVRN